MDEGRGRSSQSDAISWYLYPWTKEDHLGCRVVGIGGVDGSGWCGGWGGRRWKISWSWEVGGRREGPGSCGGEDIENMCWPLWHAICGGSDPERVAGRDDPGTGPGDVGRGGRGSGRRRHVGVGGDLRAGWR